jgi:hypothetical protein
MVMKTFRVLMALAVMVVIVGATAAAPAATMAGERTGAVGRAKPADKAAVKTVAPETKRAKKQEQAAKKTDKPADKSAPPKATPRTFAPCCVSFMEMCLAPPPIVRGGSTSRTPEAQRIGRRLL